jgi:hypothetical protein
LRHRYPSLTSSWRLATLAMVGCGCASSQACRCPLWCFRIRIHKWWLRRQRRLWAVGLLLDFPPAQFCLETGPATDTTEVMPPVPDVRRLQGSWLRHIGKVLHDSRTRVVVCSRCTPLA